MFEMHVPTLRARRDRSGTMHGGIMATDNKEDRQSSSAENSPTLQIIEISSDSEDDVFCQPQPRSDFSRVRSSPRIPINDCSKFASALQGEKRHCESGSTWDNDVIELTDSESGNSSDLPDTLSPLVKGPRKEFAGSTKQRPPFKKHLPLYLDTSDDGESDKDYILTLNDPPGSRRPIRNIFPAKGQDVAKGNPLLDSPKKDAVPEFSQAARKSPNKRSGRSAHKAKEQARRHKYATELFAELNKDVFDERLPKNTTLEWSKRLLTTAGRARWHRSRDGVHITKIELASKILDCDERIRNTLSHEMCHLGCWVIDNHPREGHGQLFKSWANKVMHRHPDIHISTRHNYEISYPYEWSELVAAVLLGISFDLTLNFRMRKLFKDSLLAMVDIPNLYDRMNVVSQSSRI
ncbi:SprT-like family-domain-containing protein [Butyriboletus roseoflavus]|nr:SprT-like family-domain-containing protein [Butyriboletus roseoflavus]